MLKGATGLAGLLGLALVRTTPALATCDNLTPTTGQTVTCSTAGGTETNSIITGNNVTDVTINFEPGFRQEFSTNNRFGANNARNALNMSNATTIAPSWGVMSLIGPFFGSVSFNEDARENVLTLEGSATIFGAPPGGAGVGFSDGATDNVVTLNDEARIMGRQAIGFADDAVGNTVTLNGETYLSGNSFSGAALSFGLRPANNNVTLYDTASVVGFSEQTSGLTFGDGGAGNTVTLAQGSSVVANGTGAPAIRDGDGSLTVVSAGLLSSASGVAVDLGDGDDSLTLQDGAQVVGQVDGGGGTDTLILEGSTGLLDINHVNFENLTVAATITDGVWDVTSDLVLTGTANVNQGRLSVNATFTAPTVAVAAGASLGGTGTINSAVILGGILAPGNSVGTMNVVGNFAFGAGASYDVEVDRTGMDLLAVSGAPGTVTIDPATTVNVIFLDKAEGHAGNIVTATGGITGSFGTLSTAASPANSIAATLVQTATAIRLVTAAPSVFSSQVWAGSEEGFGFQDMLSDEAGASRTRTDRRGWTSATYRNAERSRSRTIQPFDQNLHGTALGTDLYREGSIRIGAAVGYTGSEVELGSATGEGDFDSIHAGLYGSYHRGGYFLDGTVTGGYQDGDGERVVIVDGATLKAKADSGGYLVGTSVRTGWTLPLGGGWSARPSVGFSYMHRHQDRYSERGAGDAGVSLDSEKSDTARMNWQVQVARASTVNLGGTSIALRPSARLGLMREWALDDRNIEGRFQADGSPFSLHMDARDETLATFGVGIDATIDGWTLFAAYDGAASQITDRNTVTAGIRKAW